MATIDKTSVREEVDRLRREFEQLCADGKVAPDTRVLVNSLLVVVELISPIFLERKTRKNSMNSSLPPSQTEKDETSTNSASKGKGRRLAGGISNTRTVETVTAAWVEELCAPRFVAKGRPSIPPGVYLRMLFLGYLEGFASDRAIARNCQDRLSLRAFQRILAIVHRQGLISVYVIFCTTIGRFSAEVSRQSQVGLITPLSGENTRVHRAAMHLHRYLSRISILTLGCGGLALGFSPAGCLAAKLLDAGPLDNGYLLVHIADGEVVHHEGTAGDEVIRYTPELDAAAATRPVNWRLSSEDDPAYGNQGLHPIACHRKKKLNGHARFGWDTSVNDFRYEYTYEHWLYLQVPSPLQQGATYRLTVSDQTNIDTTDCTITFDVYSHISEAYFPSRYVYAHNEFTPWQTMRGKMVLYAYLWGLGKQRIADNRFPLHLYLPAILQAGKQR